ERFRVMPLQGTTLLKDFLLMIQNNAFDLRLEVKAFRNVGETIDNGLKRFLADRSRLGLARVFRLENRSGFSELCFLAGLPYLVCRLLLEKNTDHETDTTA